MPVKVVTGSTSDLPPRVVRALREKVNDIGGMAAGELLKKRISYPRL